MIGAIQQIDNYLGLGNNDFSGWNSHTNFKTQEEKEVRNDTQPVPIKKEDQPEEYFFNNVA